MTRGFTLVEILLVLVIAGILIAIAVPSFERYLERSRLGETVVAIGDMQKTITDYERAKGKLPDTLMDRSIVSRRERDAATSRRASASRYAPLVSPGEGA